MGGRGSSSGKVGREASAISESELAKIPVRVTMKDFRAQREKSIFIGIWQVKQSKTP